MPACVLPLLAKPNLHGVLNGLTIQRNQLVLDRKMFPCCEGTGEICDAKTKSVERCDLTRRLTALQHLIKLGHVLCEKGPQLILQKPMQKELLGELQAISQHSIHKGRVFTGVGDSILLWDYALAAVWRFGLVAFYVHPGKSSVPLTLEAIRKLKGNQRAILFIEPVSKLWDATTLQDFATLIDFTYNALIPCWIRFEDPPAAVEPKPGRTKYAERMSSYKSREALDWLPLACRNRLQAMCVGWGK